MSTVTGAEGEVNFIQVHYPFVFHLVYRVIMNFLWSLDVTKTTIPAGGRVGGRVVGWSGGWVGGRVGGRVAGYHENKANLSPTELSWGLAEIGNK